MRAITIEKISFSYTEKQSVIDKLSLALEEGNTLGIIGSNGCGKTTLFNLITGLLTPDSGQISIYDKKVKPKSFNPLVGYVFQNPDDQLFSLTVKEDIMFGPYNLGFPKSEVEKRTSDILKDMELLHLQDRMPHHLSLGEKRMVSIASILSLNPKILIFDEPTSSLDVKSRRILINYLNRLKLTKIISSHDFDFILETCKETSILHDGTIKAIDDTKKILSDEELMLSCEQEVPLSLR